MEPWGLKRKPESDTLVCQAEGLGHTGRRTSGLTLEQNTAHTAGPARTPQARGSARGSQTQT